MFITITIPRAPNTMKMAPRYMDESAGVKLICDSKNFGKNAANPAKTNPSQDAQSVTKTQTGFETSSRMSVVRLFMAERVRSSSFEEKRSPLADGEGGEK